MSGRRIDDHSNWIGGKSKGSPFPDGGHKLKSESSAEGFGDLSHYEDTTESIRSMQVAAKGKVKGHPMKSGTRH